MKFNNEKPHVLSALKLPIPGLAKKLNKDELKINFTRKKVLQGTHQPANVFSPNSEKLYLTNNV